MLPRLSPLTLLVILAQDYEEKEGLHHSKCMCCGQPMVSDTDYFFCSNDLCKVGISSAFDYLLTAVEGDTARAQNLLLNVGRHVTKNGWNELIKNHKITTWWKQKTNAENTAAIVLKGKLRGHDLVIPHDRYAKILSKKDVLDLIDLAQSTRAIYPTKVELQKAYLAVPFSTRPDVIDRIILTSPTNQVIEIIWNAHKVGFSGLQCIPPTGDISIFRGNKKALTAHRRWSSLGLSTPIIATQHFDDGDSQGKPWLPENVTPHVILSENQDARAFNVLGDAVPHELLSASSQAFFSPHYDPASNISWKSMRMCLIRMVMPEDERMTAALEDMLEWVAPDSEESAEIIKALDGEGRLELAQRVKETLSVQVIFKSPQLEVRATACDYLAENSDGERLVANFRLNMTHNVFMQGAGEVFHAGRIVFQDASAPIVLSSSDMENPRHLQDRVRTSVMNLPESRSNLPTIIDATVFKKHITPFLRQVVAKNPSKEGLSEMGWSTDKKRWYAPGAVTDMDGLKKVETFPRPGVSAFTCFNTEHHWNAEELLKCTRAAREIIAMTISQVVRAYLGVASLPIYVRSSPGARLLLQGLHRSIGQEKVFELNPNARENSGVQGISGYPLLVTGYNKAQARTAKFGHTILGDEGYSVEVCGEAECQAAATTFQRALCRVVEWCLGTDAAEFEEQRSFCYQDALKKEGSWLMQHVCEIQPWEVQTESFQELEKVIGACSLEDIEKRFKLDSELKIQANLDGMEFDEQLLSQDLSNMGIKHSIEGSILIGDSVKFIPALKNFYGVEPQIPTDMITF